MSNTSQYQVNTQYFYNNKWHNTGDHTKADSLEEVHKIGLQLIESQRTPICGGCGGFNSSKEVERRYVVRELVYVSEPL